MARIGAILRVIAADATDPERVRRAGAAVARLQAQLDELAGAQPVLAAQVSADPTLTLILRQGVARPHTFQSAQPGPHILHAPQAACFCRGHWRTSHYQGHWRFCLVLAGEPQTEAAAEDARASPAPAAPRRARRSRPPPARGAGRTRLRLRRRRWRRTSAAWRAGRRASRGSWRRLWRCSAARARPAALPRGLRRAAARPPVRARC